jgi:hypothetical protein
MDGTSRIRRAQSCATDARDAAREFHAAVVQPNMALVVFFCSVEYDLDILAAELRRLFAGVHVIGCTAVLRIFGNLLKGNSRASDIVCRHVGSVAGAGFRCLRILVTFVPRQGGTDPQV